MLVLSRKLNEKIVIEDGRIEIEVLQIRGDKVRLGFKAAKGIPIHRLEVYETIQREKRESSEE